jgi:hypothetical protein
LFTFICNGSPPLSVRTSGTIASVAISGAQAFAKAMMAGTS